MLNLDEAIASWRRQMTAGGVGAPEVLDELESHLRDDVERQSRSGFSLEQAFTDAMSRIGRAGLLRAEFEKAELVRRARWRKYRWRACGVGAALFAIGAVFCYLVILPTALRANRQYASWLGIQADPWHGGVYWGVQCRLMLAMGFALAAPGILLSLVKDGLLNYRKLAGLRRHVIVLNLVLGALLTTPEVLTQILTFVPLQLIYEGVTWIAMAWERKEGKRA